MTTSLGFIGQRGMVGSVLTQRMREEGDFSSYATTFFSTSSPGGELPDWARKEVSSLGPGKLADAHNLDQLAEMDIIITCQGGDYTLKVYDELRSRGWGGYWIDAASSLRMRPEAMICLDPVNLDVLKQGLESGVKTFIGGNCTVSLLLMAIGGLIREGLVEWVSTMTYQAASGGGARHMRELLLQMRSLTNFPGIKLDDSSQDILQIDRLVQTELLASHFPKEMFQAPLAASLIPWIDSLQENGQTREEWKAQAEANKILNRQGDQIIPIDGTCVRMGAMRSHSQGLTIKLKKDVPLSELEGLISETSPWTELIANNPEETRAKLTPVYTSGTLKIPVGRVRKLSLGPQYLNAFTVGDQLLWGAAEPLRRMLGLISDFR